MITFPITQLQNASAYDFGNCLFHNDTQYLSISQQPHTNFGTGDFTFLWWVYIPATTPAGQVTVFSRSIDFNQLLVLRIEVVVDPLSGQLRARSYFGGRNGDASTQFNFFSQNYFGLGSWAMICVGREGTQYFTYNNGQPEFRVNEFRTNITIPTDWRVGGEGAFYHDNAIVFGRAISRLEALQLYNGGRGNSSLGMGEIRARYDFNEGSGTASSLVDQTILDATVYANHAVPVGWEIGQKDFVSHYTLL